MIEVPPCGQSPWGAERNETKERDGQLKGCAGNVRDDDRDRLDRDAFKLDRSMHKD